MYEIYSLSYKNFLIFQNINYMTSSSTNIPIVNNFEYMASTTKWKSLISLSPF